MNKKVLKTISILVLAVLTVFAFTTPIFAADADAAVVDYSNFDSMDVTKVKGNDSSGASAAIGNIASAILNIVQVIAMFTAVIMLIVLAIKYISAAPNDKAEIKKHAVVYIVGAIVLFGASGIIQIVKTFATTNIKPVAK